VNKPSNILLQNRILQTEIISAPNTPKRSSSHQTTTPPIFIAGERVIVQDTEEHVTDDTLAFRTAKEIFTHSAADGHW
jgi:hypothetical protein